MKLPGFLEIGKIVGAVGLKGEIRIYPSTDFPERFESPGQRWLLRPDAAAPEQIELRSGYFQPGKGLYVVKLAGIIDRNSAEALRGCLLLVRETDRPRLDPGEFFVADLVGMAVFDQATGVQIGTVKDIYSAGNDLLEVARFEGQQPVLIPFVEAIVPVVDLQQRRLEITPPPGLID
jgi:16S rRNA processing protein RimM